MTIHFDFTLEDDEAELIYGVLNSYIDKMHLNMMKAMTEKKSKEVDWYKKHLDWFKRTKAKLKNERIEG